MPKSQLTEIMTGSCWYMCTNNGLELEVSLIYGSSFPGKNRRQGRNVTDHYGSRWIGNLMVVSVYS